MWRKMCIFQDLLFEIFIEEILWDSCDWWHSVHNMSRILVLWICQGKVKQCASKLKWTLLCGDQQPPSPTRRWVLRAMAAAKSACIPSNASEWHPWGQVRWIKVHSLCLEGRFLFKGYWPFVQGRRDGWPLNGGSATIISVRRHEFASCFQVLRVLL